MSGPGAARRRPWWLAAIVLVAGMLVTAEGLRLPLGQDYAQLGPGFLLLVVGLALTALGIACAWQLWQGVAYEPEEAEGVDLAGPPSHGGLLMALMGVVAPLAAIPWLGFPVGGALSYTLVTHAFGSRATVIDFAIGFAVAALAWLGFKSLGVDLGAFFPLWRL